MGRWDKKESEFDAKLKKYSEKISTKQASKSPAWLRKFEFKLAYFKLKYGIKLTIRQFWITIIGINIFAFIILPMLINPVEPWRLIILLASWLLYFIIDKGDGTRRKKDPPGDESGDSDFPKEKRKDDTNYHIIISKLQ